MEPANGGLVHDDLLDKGGVFQRDDVTLEKCIATFFECGDFCMVGQPLTDEVSEDGEEPIAISAFAFLPGELG